MTFAMATIDPSRADVERLRKLPQDTPVTMLNLLRFRERAAYPADAAAAPCSGRDAYARYSEVAAEKVRAVGGRPAWIGEALVSFIAPAEERWDEMLLVDYPTLAAFLQMLAMPDYQAATIHRTAALSDARLIVTRTPRQR